MNPRAATEKRLEAGPSAGQYLTFLLAADAFAIGILSIKEIIEYGGMTQVPLMPDYIRGVINLRGAVVPVMDLMVRFGKPAAPVGKRTCIVIVEITSGDEPQVIGVIVDAVQAVVEIAAADTLPAPSFGTRIDADFIAGMGKIDERFIILLNVERVLSADDAGAIGAIGTLAAAGEAGATGSALVLAGPV